MPHLHFPYEGKPMRIRPFFWFLLALSCIGALVFAATIRTHAPAVMQVHINQQPPLSVGFTSFELHLTDSQGLPIEEARLSPSARMTNMDMVTNTSKIRALGQGNYTVQLQLYMAGPWEISILAHAEGFDPLQQTLFVQVRDENHDVGMIQLQLLTQKSTGSIVT